MGGMLEGAVVDDGEDDEPDEPEAAPGPKSEAKKGKEKKDKEEKKDDKKDERNWSAVNLAYVDSKLPYKGSFSAPACTNWFWYRMIRPELVATKASLPEMNPEADFGIDAVEEVLGEYAPKI